jgi:hypothetical protein
MTRKNASDQARIALMYKMHPCEAQAIAVKAARSALQLSLSARKRFRVREIERNRLGM